MASINTNVAAQMAANALAKNDRAMTQTMEWKQQVTQLPE